MEVRPPLGGRWPPVAHLLHQQILLDGAAVHEEVVAVKQDRDDTAVDVGARLLHHLLQRLVLQRKERRGKRGYEGVLMSADFSRLNRR